MDLALQAGGEVTNGNSPYEAQVLGYLNQVHMTLISGGTIPIGKDATVEIDEVWPWSKADKPLSIELQPKYDTGTVSLTEGSPAGTFSSAPAVSLEGHFLRLPGKPGVFRIDSHVAASASFYLGTAYTGATASGLSYEAIQLDYKLLPGFITTNSENDQLQFQTTAGTTITVAMTHGVRSPADHAAYIQTLLTANGGASTYTATYSSLSRKFTLTSTLAGTPAQSFILVGTESNYSHHKTLGFDDENTTSAASHTSTYALGGIARLVEPMKINRGLGKESGIFGTDAESFARSFPLDTIPEATPDRFCVVREDEDGLLTVRFNGFPREKIAVSVDYVPIPRDLKDNSYSIPLVPRKHIEVLKDAAVFFLMLCKSDNRMQVHANLLQGRLLAMIAQHRGSLQRSGEFFGQIIPRRDKRRLHGKPRIGGYEE